MNSAKMYSRLYVLLGIAIGVIGGFFGIVFIFVFISILSQGDFILWQGLLLFAITAGMDVVPMFLFIKGVKIINLYRRYKTYLPYISDSNTSIEELAIKTQRTNELVKKDLVKLIRRRFIENAYIDLNANKLIFIDSLDSSSESENKENTVETVKCVSCGADNSVEIGVDRQCEYCGSKI